MQTSIEELGLKPFSEFEKEMKEALATFDSANEAVQCQINHYNNQLKNWLLNDRRIK